MTVQKMIEALNLTLVTKTDFEDKKINGCYIGDLLSWVMSKAQSGNVWLTIQTNINIVAVSSLTDCACIILCDNAIPDDNALLKADEQDIIILKTNKSSYQLAVEISKIL